MSAQRIGDRLRRVETPRRTLAKSRIEDRLVDEARFLRTWFDKPKLMGAVSPSGRFLARVMASHVDPQSTTPVVELGPGTGPITEALLARGVTPDRLILVEYDPSFCRLLQRRFPGVRVVQCDAYRLRQTLDGLLDEQPGTIVSSLPLLTKPEQQRAALLREGLDLMGPSGRFIQFTYGLGSPVPCLDTAIRADVSPLVWLNLPPARVWIYRATEAGENVSTVRHGRATPDLIDRLRSHTERMGDDIRDFCTRGRRARHADGAGDEAAAPLLVRTTDPSRFRRP